MTHRTPFEGLVIGGGPSSAARISEAVGGVWGRYARKKPSSIRTEFRGDVVICTLTEAVASFNSAMAAPGSFRSRPTFTDYEREAIRAVVGVTRQQVQRMASDHDEATDVATEMFTLERGSKRSDSR